MAISNENQVLMDNLRSENSASNDYNLKLVREMFLLYVNAEKAVLTGQSYQIGGQSLTRADLDKIRKGRQEWMEINRTLEGRSGRVSHQVVPVDN